MYYSAENLKSNQFAREFHSVPNWVLWGENKVPLTPSFNLASVTDPAHWCVMPDYGKVLKEYKDNPLMYGMKHKPLGLGFVYTLDLGLIVFDFDDCIANGIIDPVVNGIIERLDSYTEYSPSGKGIRLVCRCTLDTSGYRNKVNNFEQYRDKRYCTFTNKPIRNMPVATRDAEILSVLNEHFGKKSLSDNSPSSPIEINSDVERAAMAYLNKCPGSVSGDGASGKALYIAGKLVHYFCLSVDDALPLYQTWGDRGGNPEGSDQWSESELRHKLESVAKKTPLEKGTYYDSYVIDVTDKVCKPYEIPTERETIMDIDSDMIEEKKPMARTKKGYLVENLNPSFETTYIVDKHIEADSLVVLASETGSLKTFLAIDICCSVAAGVETAGGFKTIRKPVVYVCSEGQRGIKKRIMAWELERKIKVPDKTFLVVPHSFFLDTTDAPETLLNIIANDLGFKPGLIVIDTLARNMSDDENSTKVMNQFIQGMDKLRNMTKAAVLVVHHTGWDKTRERGSSALRANVDTLFKCKLDKDTNTLSVISEKTKDDEAFRTYCLTPKKISLPKTTATSLVLIKQDNNYSAFNGLKSEVRQFLIILYNSTFPSLEFTRKEAIEIGDKSARTIDYYIEAAVGAGLIINNGRGKFSITDELKTIMFNFVAK